MKKSNLIFFQLGRLPLYDLLQMYEVHEAYQKAIAQNVMKNYVLNISSISKNYDVRDAFRALGRFATAVNIRQSDIQYKKDEYSCLEEILRIIGKRCSREHLKKITITFDLADEAASAFRTTIPESMLAMESLTIVGANISKQLIIGGFLQAFKECKLLSISLKNMRTPENSLEHLTTRTLRELYIVNCHLTSQEVWREFFEKGIPSLESLTWIGTQTRHLSISKVDIAKAFPALKRLNLDVSCLNIVKLPKITHLKMNPDSLFTTEILKFMQLLTEIDSLEELSISKQVNYVYSSSCEMTSAVSKVMRQLTKLRSFEIETAGLEWDVVFHLIEQIPQVSTISLIGTGSILQTHIKAFAKMANIRCVKLKSKSLSSFNDVVYDWMVSHRIQWHNDSPPIDIYIDAKVFQYLTQCIYNYANKSKHIQLHPLLPGCGTDVQ